MRALKPTAQYVTYWDDTTPGFGIRVGKRSKTWTVMRGRQRERVSVGKYPDLSLADARAEAKRLLSESPEPKALSITFASARDQFLEENYVTAKQRTKDEAARL
ncbi:MAG: site-specific recombinase, phage integrase family, partial [Caulobacteraceae bacterium]|nr:site-specific recombinase, phage integrase family [Caulobacteraceae bacterium]